MALQEIMVFAAVGLALAYLSARAYKALSRKNCGSACKGCSSIDLSKAGISKIKQRS